jgi:hypothetical protein
MTIALWWSLFIRTWWGRRKSKLGLPGVAFWNQSQKADGQDGQECPSQTSKIPRPQNPHDRLLHDYAVIRTFPAIFLRPIESEDDLAADG